MNRSPGTWLTVNHLHGTIYFLGLALMIISLPLSRFGMSVSQFILVGNWLWEGQLRDKWQLLKRNIPFWVVISLFLMHLLGMVYTTDFEYGFKDLRTKLPLLILPVILASSRPLSGKRFHLLLNLYTIAVLAGTLISLRILITQNISDIREISPLISHIRFSLNVCIALFISSRRVVRKGTGTAVRLMWTLLTVWFFLFLFILESVTGIAVVLLATLIFSVYHIARQRNIYRVLAGIVALLAVISLPLMWLHDEVKSYYTPHLNDLGRLDMSTPRGNPYTHDTVHLPVENGSCIGIYVSGVELKDSWEKRSRLAYDGKDGKGNELRYTLIRYLNSRNLRKDADGVGRLSDEDIRSIEQGIANTEYLKGLNIRSRLYKILWEIGRMKQGGNPGGHSLLQRLEFWKAARGIIEEHFWTGVGTGDLDQAFRTQFDKMNSPLAPGFRWRTHNQYMAMFATFGFFGFLWFLFTLLFPPLYTRKITRFYYAAFLITLLISMLTEDTLETQAGATFFAFLNALYLFGEENHPGASDQ
ncbi:MAG: O-antigen ligase family protein [Bacteroidales bacterium]|nr:O-antigen ligase family protein [Bacteroidales bacterium]